MKLGICVPARDQVHTGFARSLCYLTNRLTANSVDFELHIVCGSVIAESRNQLATEALEHRATHLLWLDSDMHFPPNVVEKFLAHNKDIVAGNYSTRYAPYRSVAFVDSSNTELRLDAKAGLHKIWAVGMGCMLVKAEVYKQLPKPWYNHEYNKDTDTFSGEDIYFCNQAYHHDIDVWIDADIQLAHFGTKANIL
jgi:choline kinase|tara:strand:- start:6815 stop:7399 length:585 start_codon:yes stop_codon:yes gene_type:complete